MSASTDPNLPPPGNEPEAEPTLHSPIKPLLWMAAVLAALIAFGVLTK